MSRELKAAAGGTVRANNGVQLRVPAHVMKRNGMARITSVGHGVYDLQILAPWSGSVNVTIPLEGHGDEVMHKIGGYWVPESDKIGQGTVRVDHLSPFSALSSLAGKAVGAFSNFLCIKLTVHLFLECLLKKGLSHINSDLAHWLLGKLSSSCAGALFVDGVGGGLVDIALGAINEPACTGSAGGPGYTYPPSAPPSSTPAASGSTPSSGWIRISWSQAHRGWIAMTLGQFTSGTYRYTCNFGGGDSGTYTIVVTSDPQTFDNGQTCFDSAAGDTLWVTAGSQSSNTLTVPASSGGNPPPPPPPTTLPETVGGNAHTWTNYSNAGGTEGPTIPAYDTVQISCKVQGFRVQDGDTWWYRIASSPWNNNFYVSADAFYNNGQTSGSLIGTPFVDNNVPNC